MAHNSWLLADAYTGEIMRLELGPKYQNVQRKMDGYLKDRPTQPWTLFKAGEMK